MSQAGLFLVDDHTGREVYRDPESGRLWTRLPAENELRPVSALTVRSTLQGGTSIVVSLIDVSTMPRPTLSLVKGE